MKNAVFFALLIVALAANSQTDKTWAFGIGCGLHGNNSKFSGGSEIAPGEFNHNEFGTGALEWIARYDHNEHWMFTTGLGFTTYGFEFTRTVSRYSLKNEDEFRQNVIRNEFGAIEIPMMAFYKFKLDCRNARWLIGAGFAKLLTGKEQNIESYSVESDEGNIADPKYLTSDATAGGGGFTMLRFAVSRERIMKRGSIVQVGLWVNWGLKTIAETTVSYTADGEEFSHSFSNSGSFVGIRASFFFKRRHLN